MQKTINKHNVSELIAKLGLDTQLDDPDPTSATFDKGLNKLENNTHKARINGPEGPQMVTDALSALKHLTRVGYGINNDEFENIAKPLSWFVGTSYEDKITEAFIDHCESVGGNFDAERELNRLKSFDKTDYSNKRQTLASLVRIAKMEGWQLPKIKSKPVMMNESKGEMFTMFGQIKPKPINWLIDGLIESDSLGVLYGPPASGKSFIALDLAFSVAGGYPFHGMKVEQGPVFYIAGEGQNGLSRRRIAWEQKHNIDLKFAPIFLRTIPAPLTDEGVSETIIEGMNNSMSQLTDKPPALIVIDTLAKNFGGADENSTKDMNSFVNSIVILQKRFNCSVLVVHHTGKNESQGARGNSALKAGVDFEYSAKKVGNLVSLSCHKMKDAEEPKPMSFNLNTVIVDDELTTSCVLTQATTEEVKQSKPSVKKLGANQKTLLGEISKRDFEHEIGIDELRTSSTLDARRFKEAMASLEDRNIVKVDIQQEVIHVDHDVLKAKYNLP